MVPAFGIVVLPQNPSTGNGQIPGWSCILGVVTEYTSIYVTDFRTLEANSDGEAYGDDGSDRSDGDDLGGQIQQRAGVGCIFWYSGKRTLQIFLVLGNPPHH